MEKNPDFDGTFHIMGHSLGSVICYDVGANFIVFIVYNCLIIGTSPSKQFL